MKIIDKRIYRGRNLYSHKLCIRLTVDVEELADVPTKELPGFNRKLVDALPGLAKHSCSLGYEGGFMDRLKEGTYLPHVFEHMLIEMQNFLGFTSIRHGKARKLDGSVYHVIIQYENEDAALLCADAGLKCINAFIRGSGFAMPAELEKIEKLIASKRMGPSTLAIYNEAARRGIPVMRIGRDSMLQLGYGKNQRRVEATLTEMTSCIGVDVSCDKELTREVLQCAGIPVAPGDVADNVIGVIRLCRKLGFPIVIKPVNGCKGNGVTVGIADETAAIEAYNEALRFNAKVIVEKQLTGNDYRILVIDGRVAAAARRIPPFVTGDGIKTIMDLIEIENENILRGYDHEKPMTKIVIDDIVIGYLRKNGMNLAYIPKAGEKVTLRFNANLSTGGVAEDCTDNIHPEYARLAVSAAKAVGLDIAGIDICAEDLSKHPCEQQGAVIEVNAAPGIRMHMHPSYGKTRNVAADIIDYLYRNEERKIPLVSVTGTNGKTTVTRMINHILSSKGQKTGMTVTGGVYINNRLVSKGDTTGPESAKMVLMDREVEAAVLETARGGLLRSGLGYDLADVGVITNISEDHLGIDGINTLEELGMVKALVVEAVRRDGYAVMNADDENSMKLVNRITCKLILFSMDCQNPLIRKHMEQNGKCVYYNEGMLYYHDGQMEHELIGVADIPATMDGRLRCNIENAMAAACACIGINVGIHDMINGIRSFHLNDSQNPGRFNIHDYGKFKVVVDYGHNTEAYRAVAACLKQLGGKRNIGIIGVPGDRTNKSIVELGRISAATFDYIYIKEDMDKRGRKSYEIAQLLEHGVKDGGMGKDSYKIILNEGEALGAAVRNAREGDIITIFYEDLQRVREVLDEIGKPARTTENCIKLGEQEDAG